MQSLKTIVNSNKNNLAFIVGNGINRYKSIGNSESWDCRYVITYGMF